MKCISKIGKIIMKILEIFHWVAAALMAAAAVCSVAASNYIGYFVGIDLKECCGAELSVYGFDVRSAVTDGNVDMTVFMIFGIGAVVILALMAIIFRNMHLIFKRSESETPFSKDNIRRMKKIGIFSIAIPVIGLIMSVLLRLIVGPDMVEISVDQSGIIMGIIVLGLTQYFAYGAELEKDVEGLL